MVNATNSTVLAKGLTNPQNIVDFGWTYLQTAPSRVMQGDMLALVVLLLGAFLTILIVNKLSGLLLTVIQRLMILIITLAGVYHFSQKYFVFVDEAGITIKTVIIGILGFLMAVAGMVLGIYALVHRTRQSESAGVAQSATQEVETVSKKDKEETVTISSSTGRTSLTFKDLTRLQNVFSTNAIKDQRSLLHALTYLLVGQFGVFSSKTISAPNVQTGIIILVLFIVGALLYAYHSREDNKVAIEHFGVIFVLSVVLSFILGYAWAGIPASVLFSLEFFATDSLVAIITGTAVALFAGSK